MEPLHLRIGIALLCIHRQTFDEQASSWAQLHRHLLKPHRRHLIQRREVDFDPPLWETGSSLLHRILPTVPAQIRPHWLALQWRRLHPDQPSILDEILTPQTVRWIDIEMKARPRWGGTKKSSTEP